MLRGQRRPGKKWTETDRLLILALQAYEDDLCPGCGQPRTYGMDGDAQGHYAAHKATCWGCSVKQRADKAEKEPPPGQYRYVVADDALRHAMTHPIHVPPFHT